ncbi:hypothetical protein, partial [Luteimonas aquatica]|uniref:hypothetical protein n=1 Tax=Luteimonas aquatica TaxID=450364 RepID=UPI001F5817C8
MNTAANVAVAKTGPATVTAGASYQYTLAVSNSGQTATGTNVVVQDQLPAGAIATAVTGANCGPLPSSAGALLTCTIPGPIAGGGSTNVVLTVTAPATGGSITNYAATNPTGTGNPGTPPGPGCTSGPTVSCSSATTTVNAPLLSMAKTHSGNFVVGTNGTYTLTVSNTGTA